MGMVRTGLGDSICEGEKHEKDGKEEGVACLEELPEQRMCGM
jgi:hypothetical protein